MARKDLLRRWCCLHFETLEPRNLLSGLGRIAERLTLDQGLIPLTAAGDADAGFSWSGWQSPAGEAGVQTASLQYRFAGRPQVSEAAGLATVTLDGLETWAVEGQPTVPVRVASILLPQGTQIEQVDIDYGSGSPLAQGIRLGATPLGPASDVGGVSDFSTEPADVASYGGQQGGCATHTLCGYNFAEIPLFPVQYDAATEGLTYYDTVSLTVSTRPSDKQGCLAVREATSDVERIAAVVDNASAVRAYALLASQRLTAPASGQLPYAGRYEYVIVTRSDLADAFQPLVQHKIGRNLSATLVTTDYIYSHFSGLDNGDNPDKIRDFLRAAYQQWGTEWVLLGGDTSGHDLPAGDANSVVPHRGCFAGWDPGGHYNNLPTDVYFACLDGPWNHDGDNLWGERNTQGQTNGDGAGGGDVDLVPEIFVGRAPVSNAVEATNFVNKTILYETIPPPNPKWGLWLGEELDRAKYATPQDPSHSDVWGGDHKNDVQSYCAPGINDWTLLKRYDKDHPDDVQNRWTGADLIADLNASPAIVNHFGHANEVSNAKLSRADVDSLTNAYPYFMYSAGCLSGAFDYGSGDSIAEHHVKGAHGAVGVVMNTREGQDIQKNSANYKLDMEFWNAIFVQGRRHFGEALDYAKSKILVGAQLGVASRWMYFACTLFGDPETSLAEPGRPVQLAGTVYHDRNGNGEMDLAEEGLAGRRVYVDVGGDGTVNERTDTRASQEVPRVIPDPGAADSNLRTTGLTGLVTGVDVTLNLSPPLGGDLVAILVSTSGRSVQLLPGVSHYEEFNGQDPNGLWTLILIDQVLGFLPVFHTLSAWSITITHGDPITTTDAGGHYQLNNLIEGRYTVREVPDTSWLHTNPATGKYDVLASYDREDLDFGNAMTSTLTGRKWHDSNGNGRWERGEEALANWRVYLDLDNDRQRDAGEPSTLTDGSGNYSFPALRPGNYVVREEEQAGWYQVTPGFAGLYGLAKYTGNMDLVVIDRATGGAAIVGPTGDSRLVGLASDGVGALYSISANNGRLYSVNPLTGEATALFAVAGGGFGEGDLAMAPGASVIYAVRVFLEDSPELFRIDLTTRTATSMGELRMGGSPLPWGVDVSGLAFRGSTLYALVGQWQPGINDARLITIDTATCQVSVVGSVPAPIGVSGGLAYDAARDWFYAGGWADERLWTISPVDGSAAEVGRTGLRGLSGLTGGTLCGTPFGEAHLAFAPSGAAGEAGGFGNRRNGTLRGAAWEDLDADGQVDADEPPLGGWTIYRDTNNNGYCDENIGCYYGVNPSAPVPDRGKAVSTISVSGAMTIRDVNVVLNISHPYDGDLEVVLISPAGTRVQLINRVGGSGHNFGTWPPTTPHTILDDEATTPISGGTAPFVGAFAPAQALSALDGQDANGIWALEVIDHAAGDAGALNLWYLRIESGEWSTQTNASGQYSTTGAPATYIVGEALQNGWTETFPASHRQAVVIGEGETVSGINFGNARKGEMRGIKYEDRNGNARRDEGEGTMAGWTIYLDVNGDGQCSKQQRNFGAVDVPKTIPATGVIRSTLAYPAGGAPERILDLEVVLNSLKHEYDPDLSVYLISPAGTRVKLFSRLFNADGNSGEDFRDTVLDDQADAPLESGFAPFTGAFRPQEPLSTFNFEDPVGTWYLEVVDGVEGDAGRLESWGLRFLVGDPSTVTNRFGEYVLGSLPPGATYVAREQQQAGWQQTAPAGGYWSVYMTSGLMEANKDFGNRRLATVLYWDQHGDGAWNAVDGQTGRSRWVDAQGGVQTRYPDDAGTTAVVRTNQIAATDDYVVRDLTIESGTLQVAAQSMIHVTGRLAMAPAGTFAVELGAADNGAVSVNGNAGLDGVLKLQAPARPVDGTTFRDETRVLVTAIGGVTGTFDSVPMPWTHLGHGVFVTASGITCTANDVRAHIFAALAGDTDGDRDVDVADIQRLLKAGKFNTGKPADWTEGDFNADGIVSAADIQMVLKAGVFGKGDYTLLGKAPTPILGLGLETMLGSVQLARPGSSGQISGEWRSAVAKASEREAVAKVADRLLAEDWREASLDARVARRWASQPWRLNAGRSIWPMRLG